MEHQQCVCGHGIVQHHAKIGVVGKCGWCDNCKKFELDKDDFLQYIRNEIHRRAEQIQEYMKYAQEVMSK